MKSHEPYPKSVWEYDAHLERHLEPYGEASYGCPACGWFPELLDCHVEFGLRTPCPYVRHRYCVGERNWRKRDFLWIVPRLQTWKRRATLRLEQSLRAVAIQHAWRDRAYAAPRGSMYRRDLAGAGVVVGA